MTEAEFDALVPGLYRVWWTSGGQSLTAVGATSLAGSPRWLACANWTTPAGIGAGHARLILRVELLYATPADVDREQARVRELEERVAALEGVFSDLLIDDEALQLAYQKGFKDALTPSEVMPCPPPTPCSGPS